MLSIRENDFRLDGMDIISTNRVLTLPLNKTKNSLKVLHSKERTEIKCFKYWLKVTYNKKPWLIIWFSSGFCSGKRNIQTEKGTGKCNKRSLVYSVGNFLKCCSICMCALTSATRRNVENSRLLSLVSRMAPFCVCVVCRSSPIHLFQFPLSVRYTHTNTHIQAHTGTHSLSIFKKQTDPFVNGLPYFVSYAMAKEWAK